MPPKCPACGNHHARKLTDDGLHYLPCPVMHGTATFTTYTDAELYLDALWSISNCIKWLCAAVLLLTVVVLFK